MAFRDAVQADGPMFYLECNETSGTVLADSSGNDLPGEIVGTATLGQTAMTPGTGTAIAFASSYAKVVGSANKTITGDYSVEIIARWSDSTNACMFSFSNANSPYNGPSIYWHYSSDAVGYIGRPDALYFRDAYDANYTTAIAGSYADGVFRHLVFVRRASAIEIWVNGVMLSSKTLPAVNSFTPPNAASFMGNIFSQYTNGSLDECAFYHAALTPDRIRLHAAWAANKARVAGTAKLDSGAPASTVVTRDWNTKALIDQQTPAADGSFVFYLSAIKVDVTAFGPDGYQPITHGPIDPVPLV